MDRGGRGRRGIERDGEMEGMERRRRRERQGGGEPDGGRRGEGDKGVEEIERRG